MITLAQVIQEQENKINPSVVSDPSTPLRVNQESQVDFAKLFIDTFHLWQALAPLYGVNSPQEAYYIYLNTLALDEHHFSDTVRQSGQVYIQLTNKFLSLSHRDRATILGLLT